MIEYFEDIKLNSIWKSTPYPVTEKEIIHFATEWNPRAMHMDTSVAEKTEMKGLIAAGAHLICITAKILPLKEPSTAIVAALSMDNCKFMNPARPGDVLILESEVLSKRESQSRPTVGIVTCAIKLVNQRNETVIRYESTSLVGRKPKQ